MKKLIALALTLFATSALAQNVNPADLADRFMICTDQAQTSQLMIMMDLNNNPLQGVYVVTDAPGSSNVQDMSQLQISVATYDSAGLNIEASSITDPNETYSLAATAVGEFNVSPTLKTTVYIGQIASPKAAGTFQCVVLDADQLAEIQQP